MAKKPLPVGENTVGINPDGTPAIGTPEQMRPLMKQWKQIQEGYERGDFSEVVLDGSDEDDISDLNEYDDLIR